MAFPTTPANGQIASINGITYTYDSTTSSWTRNSVSLPTLSVTVDTFTSNGILDSFTLSVTPAAKEYITVNIDGVLQQKTAYNLSGNVLTLTGIPVNNAIIEVKITNAIPASVVTGLVYDSFTGDGNTTQFTLSTQPTNRNFTLVTVGGVTQQKINYTISGSILTFTTAPALSAPIEVLTFGPAMSAALAGGGNSQIQFNSSGTLTGASALTFNNSTNTLTTTNISSDVVTANSIITSSFTGDVVGNVSGSSATVTNTSQPNITSLGTLTGLDVNGVTTLQLASDKMVTKAGSSGVVTHDLSSCGVFYHTGIAASFTANFINVPVTNDRVLTSTLILNQGSTPYIPSAVQIEGSAYTIKWIGSSIPTGSANKIDIVSLSLIRSSNTWTVLAALGSYG